jgi:MoaA/NifB/PqqE/SkfB family radical SAM enzyme
MRRPGRWESFKEMLLGSRRTLVCVQVEVSSRCHGRCTYCPHTLFKDQWRGRNMDLGTYRRLWPLMQRASRVHLQGWGEPLLHPDFFEMAAVARKAGCSVSTTTCGLVLTDTIATDLVKSGIDIVAFSLVGTDTDTNAARLGIPFEQVYASIERLQAIRRALKGVHLEIHFAYLLLASNMDSVRRLPELMQRLGVHAAVVSTLDYLPHPNLAKEAFLPGETLKSAEAEAILAETAAEARRMDLEFHYRLPAWDHPAAGCRENVGHTLFVSAEGDVSPCVFLNIPASVTNERRRTFGNINDRDPAAIWEDPEYAAFREGLVLGAPAPVCLSCPKRFM